MRVAFTGAALVREERVDESIERLLCEFPWPDPEICYTGGAVGVDSIAAMAARRVWNKTTKHVLVVPKYLPWNELLRVEKWDDILLIPGDYMTRNDALVRNADRLLAFPWQAEELKRSGTWATVRRARHRRIPIHIFPLPLHASWRWE